MSVRITDRTPQVLAETAKKANLALRLIADAIDTTARPRTPKRLGNLRRDVLKQVLGLRGEIRWQKRYAASQEAGVTRGRPIRRYTTPGTGPHYAENAIKEVARDSAKYFRQAGL